MERKTVLLSMLLVAAVAIVAVVAAVTNPALADDDDDVRYRVVASSNGFVLWDAEKGNAWILQSSAKHPGRFAWLTIPRIDNDRKAEEWRLRNRAGR